MTRHSIFSSLLLGLSIAISAQAGLEFTARPSKKSSAAGISESSSAKAPSRVQVFGNGEVRKAQQVAEPETDSSEVDSTATVSDYTEMLKRDAAEAPVDDESSANNEVVTAPAEVDRSDEEFQSLRNRIRTKTVAEVDETSAEPPMEIKKSARKTPTKLAPPPKPTREMETETITPQGNAHKPKSAPALSATEPETPQRNSDEVNAAFPYTHLLPSPFNLPQGAWVFGTSIAHGIFDFLEVSTNVARTIQGHWNFRGKVPLIEFPTFMASAFVDYESYNPHSIDDTNPDIRLNRWQPGMVTAFELDRDMAIFFGGNFNFGDDPIPVKTTSGYLHGAQLEVDWSWLYNPQNSRLANNALSAGVTYDTTYSMLGFGVSHHWRNFTLGIHYTLADRYRFMPIFGFQAGASF